MSLDLVKADFASWIMHLPLVSKKLRAIAVVPLKGTLTKLITQLAQVLMYLKSSKKVQRVGMRPSHACSFAQISMRRFKLIALNISTFLS